MWRWLALVAILGAMHGAGLAQESGIEQTPLDENYDIDNDPNAPVYTEEAPLVDAPKALLRGLDTLTNTVNDFEMEVGQTLAFKRLIVTLEACRYPDGDISSEAYAFLRIRDGREDVERFAGWMLASSPALSALDHPRYDVWVISCRAA